jgi:hypothetical protein
MNRQQRRQQERAFERENRQAERYAQMVVAREKARTGYINKIEQNGITLSDLEKEYDRGYDKGFADASRPMYMTMMAAISIALKELHGFGKKRIIDVLRKVDETVIYSLTAMETVEEALEKTGVELLFGEPFDRVKEK